ncbi:MAG: acyl-CoA desaturase [Reichenbachiella sp.]|uniref:fatty acid desaturase family protein n=1 Tax=Reichenbachiella sp. TaxID=2184521 RepID=UPI0032651FF3
MIRYKFSKKQDLEFTATLKSRVNAYFQENGLNRDANSKMVIKSICLFTWYLTPYFILIFGGITSIPVLLSLWVIMGLGKAFIGTAVMHDSLHGSYSKSKTVNFWMGLSAMLIGVDSLIWKIQHNVLHHTYTNIEDTDEDILPRIVFRFSRNQPKKWFHRFQHIYAPLFYCVPLLEWLTTKDFLKAFDYKKMKLIKPGAEFRKEFAAIVLRKMFYYVFLVAVPMWLIPIPAWMTMVMILVSSGVTGIMLAMIFQTAHVVPSAAFYKVEGEEVDHSWTAHQLLTTCNYGMNDKVLSWLVGGLNFQIEHHLFPDVCHVHYPQLAPIVQQTTSEFGIPYYAVDTFGDAVASHFHMLKELGRNEEYVGQPAYFPAKA